MNLLLLTLLVAGVAYMIGVANHGLPSPLSAVRRIVHGADMSTENPRSDDVHDDDADTVDMSGPPERGDVLTVSREHVARQWGVRPELAHLGGHDEQEEEMAAADMLARRVWVRAQMDAGKPAGWINREGAKRFGCDEKTIRRDRRALDDEDGESDG